MKRTKELLFRHHPEWQARAGISGCTTLDGEDPEFDFRNAEFKKQQRDWIDQQLIEKEMYKKGENIRQAAFASQTFLINRMKGNLQDEHTKKLQDVKNSVKEYNLLLAQQKKDKENEEKREKLREEQEELNLLMERFKEKKVYEKPANPKPSILE